MGRLLNVQQRPRELVLMAGILKIPKVDFAQPRVYRG
jgi:hypothetical protein